MTEKTAVIGADGDKIITLEEKTIYNVGAAYIFELDQNERWAETQKIIASDRDEKDKFGWSVALTDSSIIIGAFNESDSGTGYGLNGFGAAYIYERGNNSNWLEKQKLIASDGGFGDQFGSSVSIDGDFAIIGSPNDDENTHGEDSLPNAGAAYFYRRNENSEWLEIQKLVPSDRSSQDKFGYDVLVYDSSIVISSVRKNNDQGAVYIFDIDETGYAIEQQNLVASDGNPDDYFGRSIALSNNTLLIGSPYKEGNSSNSNTLDDAGAAYIFMMDNSPLSSDSKKPKKSNFVLFPNPCRDIINITKNDHEKIEIRVTDQSGSTVLNMNSYEKNTVLGLKNLDSGIYLINIHSKTTSIVQKLVKE